MSRFNNLEFGNHFNEQPSPKGLIKDEHFYSIEAMTAFENGRFEQALRSFSRILEYNPKNASAWTGQVRMLIELGEFDEAKLWADKALEMFPNEPELLAAKAVALARTGDLKAALLFSDASIEIKGSSSYVWLARGDVLLARREKPSDFCFEKALALTPRSWFLHWLVSRVYAFYKQFSRALKMAQQAVALDASRAVTWVQFSRCQLALGLAGPATQSLQHARELDPHCVVPEHSKTSCPTILRRLLGWWQRLFGP